MQTKLTRRHVSARAAAPMVLRWCSCWPVRALAFAAPGPRGFVGPDVPWSEAEQSVFAKHTTADGRTAAAVQAACERALKESLRVVLLPAGEYMFDATVRVPGG